MNYREAYEKWLKEFANDKKTIAELTAIAGDEKEIEDRFYTGLSFGTAGMRGVLGAGDKPHERLHRPQVSTRGLARYILNTPAGRRSARRGHRHMIRGA